ncbi:MAG: NAD(P)H-dependent oxidoreductase [Henriciella sp.]|nr:NAD(P)H-dependent oxidoreductase [Henriciella sp.]
MARTFLKLNASARSSGSHSRTLVDAIIDKLSSPDDTIIDRDVGLNPLDPVSEDWVNANFTPEDQRSDAQKDVLSGSDELIAELEAADTLVFGVPVYNFGVPSTFKAWIDQISRARKTFKYTESGPIGLLEGKRAYVVIASGGTPSGSDIDFATPYVLHALGFVGITDVEVIAADQLMADSEEKLSAVKARIDALQD